MKKQSLFILALMAMFCNVWAQEGSYGSIPEATVKTLEGKSVSTSTFSNEGKPIILSMWATWCKPCIRELNAIKDQYPDWQAETGVKIIAISIDDARNTAKVKPFVNGEGWEYEVYLDENGDLKRLLSVNSIPHTFLVDGEGRIVWQHNGYAPGDEDELFELVQKVAKGESIEAH